MNPIHILLVEDNEGDIMLTREAFDEAKIANRLDVVRDGQDAIQFLDKTGAYEGVDTPDLVLLDINLPKKNGHEILRYIKSSDKLKAIPVIMLTTSSSERDIRLSYESFANCYITKPVEVEDFMDAISKIEDFWLSIVKLPGAK